MKITGPCAAVVLGLALAAECVGVVHSFQSDPRLPADAVVATQRPVVTVVPEYPLLARRARIGADVMVAITIDATGRAADVRVTRSNPLLDDAAVEAARQWRFAAPPAGTTPVVPVTFRFAITAFAPATTSVRRGPGVPQDFAFQYRYAMWSRNSEHGA